MSNTWTIWVMDRDGWHHHSTTTEEPEARAWADELQHAGKSVSVRCGMAAPHNPDTGDQ